MIEEGELYAIRKFNENEEPVVVKDYIKYQCFGELALIKNDSRAASVIAKTDSKLLSLDRLAFKRLLGPIENILGRMESTYLKHLG